MNGGPSWNAFTAGDPHGPPADYGRFRCDYCGHEGGYPSEIETRHGKFVCRDIEACDARDAARDEEEAPDG